MRTLFLLFLLSAELVYAQAWPQVQFFSNEGDTELRKLCRRAGGGYAAAGIYAGDFGLPPNAPAAGQTDLFVMGVGDDLQPEWWFTAGDTEDDEVTALESMPNGDLLLAGSFWFSLPLPDTTLLTENSPRALFVARLTETGALRWAQKISGDGLKDVRSLHPRPDGSFVVGGYFQHSLQLGDSLLISAGEPGSTSFFLAAMDGEGQLLWVQQAGQTGDTRIEALAVGPDGQISAGGTFNGTVEIAGSAFDAGLLDTDVFVAAFSESGTPLWAKDAGGVIEDRLNAVAVDETGNIYLAGDIIGVMNISDEISIESSTGNADVFLIKYQADGQPLWARAFGGPDVQSGNALAVAEGVVAVGGNFQGPISIDGQSADTGDMSTPWGYIAGFNTSGENRWLEAIPSERFALVRDLEFTAERSLLSAGAYRLSATFGGITDEISGFGGFLAELSGQITPAPEQQLAPLSCTVFPNPTTDAWTVEWPYAETAVLRLMSSNGQQQLRMELRPGMNQLPARQLRAGMYTVQIRSGKRAVSRLVIKL